MRRTYICFFISPLYYVFPIYLLSISNIASTISFSKITITSLFMSAVRNAPGTSITATSRPSIASIAAVMNTNSVTAVGEVTSDFFYPDLCFCMSATARTFIFQHRFCFKDISTCSALCLWLLVSCLPLIGWNTTLSSICCISDFMAFIPSFPNRSSPCFRFSCINTWTMRFV